MHATRQYVLCTKKNLVLAGKSIPALPNGKHENKIQIGQGKQGTQNPFAAT